MIIIDGSIGGGQVLRTAIGLSALTLKPVTVSNIRASRERPGLAAQHLAGVKAAAVFCNAEVEGAKLHSTEVKFIPKSHDFSDKKIDIGTAGSISLLLQSLLPVLVFSDRPIRLEISGGTAGMGAPTIEYTKFVTLPVLRFLGVLPPRILVKRQGFYPKGGGHVVVEFLPSKILRARSIKWSDSGKVSGISVAGNLPESVARRQTDAARSLLAENGIKEIDIEQSSVRTDSPGSSITLWSAGGESVLGSCAIGEPGRPAEEVGRDAATKIISSIKSGMSLDSHMADQAIPFMALAAGRSEVTVEEVTDHVRTNIAVTESVLGARFEVDEGNGTIRINGIGYRP